ncbi:cellobiose dehydrogenase [Pseudovirgaria hyperparasitica]|uniref:Cellobiose dehydrogenase n=1 Tax=Pseudovirgaria hyperparasitica TaxID=470096 RepID=A0A6A6VW59_9PEZI|nr:cellobiose dehydrogenase [Pseudovirgaria hyperparasitica]KAF2753880.1 cellobiose dehydrogenase [Pseudovirgaria hyperparasitica]
MKIPKLPISHAATLSLLLLLSTFLSSTFAQESYTDPDTGITFYRQTWPDTQTKGGFQWGLALPATEEDAAGSSDEYIGQIVGARTNGAGWSGVSHGGSMPNALLLIAWADGTTVRSSFRFATGYVEPDAYTGNATLIKIAETVNATHFTLTYRCRWCWYWDQNGAVGSQPPITTNTHSAQVLAWVQAFASPEPVTSDDARVVVEHDNGIGIFGMPIASMRQAGYAAWASSATPTPPSTTVTTKTTTTTTRPPSTTTVPPGASCSGTAAPTAAYDYIIVGAGAAGIPLADRLSEAGKSVLLIEKGPPSSGRWAGTLKPTWLAGTNLTRFDVPGLCNEIWVNSAGVACTGIDQMAGCVLGGGTAVNAGLWWKPPAPDWDANFPAGWKAVDMARPVSRVFARIPGTEHPSADNRLYKQEGYAVIANALSAAGWRNLTRGANADPDLKDRVFAQTSYMFSHGERGGPLATYLVTASARKNFRLLTNTSVRRVVRTATGHATGVELEAGHCGIVNLTTNTGRVILSAGTFNTAKILFRSGIGPADQLKTVASSALDGASFANQSDWIILPVGHNLNDHANTDIVIRHPDVSAYDFYAAYDHPIPADASAYLTSRTGILAQAAPNIGPIFWHVIPGDSNTTARQLQYTARVEPSLDVSNPANTSMTISQYLGRGATSRGTLTITPALSILVSDPPYLKTAADNAAVASSLRTILAALTASSSDQRITIERPSPGTSVEAYLAGYPRTPAARRANHWIGTAKMGTDNGLLTGGTAVVDVDARVYGTDNVFVVDASVFPGHVSSNPSAAVAAVAERASERILGLAVAGPVGRYGQCAGRSYAGARFCAVGLVCVVVNPDYGQCL